jgi:uncharacterized protein (DUF924 family)
MPSASPIVSPEAVLDLWFGPDPANVTPAIRQQWFKKDPDFDARLRREFGSTWAAAANGELDAWAQTPETLVALVIVLDQFSRNLWRGDARSWAQDAKTQALVVDALERGADQELPLNLRIFLYMPLMHAEDLALQQRSVDVFQALGELDESLVNNHRYAVMHLDVIAKFGRFPHRNPILGRTSTPAEVEYLADGGGF